MSKDSRDDLPQVIVGLAVTREAIPVRVWCWPGNTADSALIRQVKKDMRDWSLGRVIVCLNPEAAVRDARIRGELISKLEELIAGSDSLSKDKRAELRGKISMMPGPNRFLRVTPGGLLRTDKAGPGPKRTWTASTCCAAPTRTCPPRTSRSATSSYWRSRRASRCAVIAAARRHCRRFLPVRCS
jgi:hypothetical protein